MLEKCHAMRDELETMQLASDNSLMIICHRSILELAIMKRGFATNDENKRF